MRETPPKCLSRQFPRDTQPTAGTSRVVLTADAEFDLPGWIPGSTASQLCLSFPVPLFPCLQSGDRNHSPLTESAVGVGVIFLAVDGQCHRRALPWPRQVLFPRQPCGDREKDKAVVSDVWSGRYSAVPPCLCWTLTTGSETPWEEPPRGPAHCACSCALVGRGGVGKVG